jgi:hypothetical protein
MRMRCIFYKYFFIVNLFQNSLYRMQKLSIKMLYS